MSEGMSFESRVQQIEQALRSLDNLTDQVEKKLSSLGSAGASASSGNSFRTISLDARNASRDIEALTKDIRTLRDADIKPLTSQISKLADSFSQLNGATKSVGNIAKAITDLSQASKQITNITSGLDLSRSTSSVDRLSSSVRDLLSIRGTISDFGLNSFTNSVQNAREEIAMLKQEMRQLGLDAGTSKLVNKARGARGGSVTLTPEPPRSSGIHPRNRPTTDAIFDEDPQFSIATRNRRPSSNPIPVSIERTSLRQKADPVTVQLKPAQTKNTPIEVKLSAFAQPPTENLRAQQRLFQTVERSMQLRSEQRLAIDAAQATVRNRAAELVDRVSGPNPTFLTYEAKRRLGFKDQAFTGDYTHITPDEKMIRYNKESSTYESLPTGRAGASLEQTATHMEVIRRAIEESSAGIAIVANMSGGFGANAVLGLGKNKMEPNHVAVAYKDKEGAIRLSEVMADATKTTATNKSGSAAAGTPLTGPRSLDAYIREQDYIKAVPLNVSSGKADKFMGAMERMTAPGNVYSFVADEEVARKMGVDVGETCATTIQKALKESGIEGQIARQIGYQLNSSFKKTSAATGFNLTTPDDVIRYVEEHNRARGGYAVEGEQKSRLDDAASSLISSYKSASTGIKGILDNIKTSFGGYFSNIGQALKNAFQDMSLFFGLSGQNPVTVQASEPAINLSEGTGGSVSSGFNFERALNSVSSALSKVQFGFSQGVGIFNSMREISQGMREGGPGGVLDIAGGGIGVMHGLQNLNSYFGLKMLPKSIEGVFNQRRSETLADVIEAIVKVTTGYQREKTLRSDVGADDKVNEGGESTGARFRKGKKRREPRETSTNPNVNEHGEVYEPVTPQTPTDIAQSHFAKIFGGTELGKAGSVQVLSAQQLRDLIKQYSPNNPILQRSNAYMPNGVGFMSPDKGYITAARTGGDRSVAQILAHELTHGLVETRKGDIMFGSQKDRSFFDDEAERYRQTRIAGMQSGSFTTELQAASTSDRYKAITKQALGNKLQYYFKPDEIFANVGESLLSANKDFERYLRSLYGDDLFNKTKEILSQNFETFGSQLENSQKRYARFSQSISGTDTVSESIATGVTQPLENAFTQLVSNARQAEDQLTAVFKGAGNALDQITPTLQSLVDSVKDPGTMSQIIDAFTKGDPNDMSSREVAWRALGRQIESPQFTSARDALIANPNDQAAQKTMVQALSNIDPTSIISEVIKTGMNQSKMFRAFNAAQMTYFNATNAPKTTPLEDLADFAGKAYEAMSTTGINVYPEVSREITARTGKSIEDYSTSSMFDLEEGITRVTASAKLAGGALVEMSGRIDALGRFIEDKPKKETFLGTIGRQFAHEIPQEIAEEAVYGAMGQVQQMFQTIVDTQDELNEVALLFGGSNPDTTKRAFIRSTVEESSRTGQGYEESLQTNLKNAKLFSFVEDPTKRLELSSKMSRLQLGAQTVFDLPQEQAMKNIPAIFAQINNSLVDIKDPALRAEEAMNQLAGVFDKLTVVQRMSAADGQNMVEIFSELAPSMQKLGMNADQLMTLSAVSDVAIAESPEETSNILKILLERIRQAGKSDLESVGIDTSKGSIDVLKQIYQLSQDPTRKADYETAVNAIGSQARANEAAKVVQAVGTNYDRVYGAAQGVGGNEFETILGRKIDAFTGSWNSLQSATARFLDTFLNGAGILESVNSLMRRLGEGLSEVSNWLDSINKEGGLKQLITGEGIAGINVADVLKFNYLDRMGVEGKWNAAEPLAKLVNAVDVRIRGQTAQVMDFRDEASRGPGMQQRIAQAALAVSDRSDIIRATATTAVPVEAIKLSEATVATKGFEAALRGVKSAATSSASAVQNVAGSFVRGVQNGRASVIDPQQATINRIRGQDAYIRGKLGSMASATPLTTAQDSFRSTLLNPYTLGKSVDVGIPLNRAYPKEATLRRSFVGKALNSIANTGAVQPGVSTIVQSPAFQRLSNVGEYAGALAMPVASDLMLGGGGKDNLTNVGVGLAGAFAGAFVGGPYGSVIGYSLAKNFSESLDVLGFFATSEKEEGTIATAIGRQMNTTPEDAAKRGGFEEPVRDELNERIKSIYKIDELRQELSSIGGENISAERIRKMYQNRQNDRGLYEGVDLSQRQLQYKRGGGVLADEKILDILSKPEYKPTLDLILDKGTNFNNIQSDLPNALDAATRNQDLIDAGIDEKIRQANEEAIQAQIQATEDSEKLYKAASEKTELAIGRINAMYEDKPYMGTQFGAFGAITAGIDSEYLPRLNAPGLSDDERSRLQSEYDLKRSSALSVGESLGTAIPLAKSLGLSFSDTDLSRQLYGLGAEGQQAVINRLRPVSEADQFTKTYEAKQSELASYEGVDLAKEENAAIAARVATLQQELDLQNEKYMLSKQIVDAAKAEGDVVKSTIAAVAANQPKQRVIRQGTPAQFVAPDIFDASDFGTDELRGAIDYARQKQNKLVGMNRGYADVFAKDQFMLESGGQFKGVAGINQGFVQEYLQQQRQKITPPEMVDLSSLSDEKRAATIARARQLQGQAVALAPDMAKDLEKERLMVMGKNNKLLMELGLSQEFLRIAMDENTEATEDTLRGHFNLPANYRPPTVWDYYNDGGREAGDVNYPGMKGQEGMVPISMAQQIAEQMLNNKGGAEGPDLDALGNTIEAGARPMFYPNPGTPSIIEQLDQLTIQSAKSDEVTIDGSSVYINGVDMTAYGQGGNRDPDWQKGMLQELAAQSVMASSNGNTALAQRYDQASALVKSGGLDTDKEVQQYLNSGGESYKGPTGTGSAFDPSKAQQSLEQLKQSTDQTANKTGTLGNGLNITSDAAAKLQLGFQGVNAILPGLGQAMLAPVQPLGQFNKQLASTIASLQKLDASKIQLNVIVNVNGNTAQVQIAPSGQAAPARGATGGAGTSALSAGGGTRRTVGGTTGGKSW